MKLLPKILLGLTAALFVTSSFAGTTSGRDSAKFYKTHPDDWDGKKVSVDCVSVTRINGGPQIDDVVFFVAHTIDDDNKARGGSIVVAVLEGDVSSFIRKYGTVVERNRGQADRIDSKSLRGTFHVLEKGHVYLDESGDAHALILERKEDAKLAIRSEGFLTESGGIGAGRRHGPGKHK
jgi:hypothetical protein